jgi:ABC-type branched-subunit amino acid transport system substrate-binding protein
MRIPLLLGLLLVSIPLPSYGIPESSSELRVGVIAPVSGDFAGYGLGAVRAMKLANDSMPGIKLSLIVEDNRSCQAPDAVTAYHKLTQIDHVDAIVTFCTAAAQAVLPLATAKKIPLFQLSEPGDDAAGYMLKLMPDSVALLDRLAKELFKKYKTIALVANTMDVNTGPRGSIPLITSAYEKLGGNVVFTRDFPDTEMDFRSIILQIRKSNAEAVVPFIWPVRQMAAFLTQGDQLHLWPQVALGGSLVFEFMYPELLKVYPALAKKEGLESVNLAKTTSANFIEAYRTRYNETPPQFADYAFDAAAILKQCGLDRECSRAPRHGASGQLAFCAQGWRTATFETKRLTDGKFIVVE